MRAQAGFTLVELVVTMVVLGILALGSTRFLTDAASGYAATNTRAQLANQARAVMNRLARDLRGALPGSVRTNGSCLELIPTQQATRYVTLPVGVSASSFLAAALPSGASLNAARVAVLPAVSPYVLTTSSTVSPTVTVSAPDAQNQITVTFAATHTFPGLPPRDRVYFVGQPRSYCVDAGDLWRYDNYGYLDPQPAPAGLPASLPGRSLFAQGVAATFTVSGATLTRGAAVQAADDAQCRRRQRTPGAPRTDSQCALNERLPRRLARNAVSGSCPRCF